MQLTAARRLVSDMHAVVEDLTEWRFSIKDLVLKIGNSRQQWSAAEREALEAEGMNLSTSTVVERLHHFRRIMFPMRSALAAYYSSTNTI